MISWDALYRTINLVITPRRLKGHELLMKTRGWWTMEPTEVAEIVERHGNIVVGEKGELMVEFKDQKDVDALSASLLERFGDQVLLAP